MKNLDIDGIEKLLHKFTMTTQHKGQAYFRAGKVKNLVTCDDEINGLVQGSRLNPYKVSIKSHEKHFSMQCSCPVGDFCKHQAAVLYAHLDYLKNIKTKVIHLPQNTVKSSKKLVQNTPNPDSKKSSTTMDVNDDVRSWVDAFNALSPSQAKPLKGKLIFLLDPIEKTFVLKFSLLTNNNRKSIRRFDLEIYSLNDFLGISAAKKAAYLTAEDLEILNFLQEMQNSHEGAKQVENSTIMQRIIKTGRCYLSALILSDPLTWGVPIFAAFKWKISQDKLSQQLVGYIDQEGFSLYTSLNSAFYYHQEFNAIGSIQHENLSVFNMLLTAPAVSHADAFAIHEIITKRAPGIITNEPIQIQIETEKPKISLSLFSFEGSERHSPFDVSQYLLARLSFDYEGSKKILYHNKKKKTDEFMKVKRENKIFFIKRDLAAENEAAEILIKQNWMYSKNNPEKCQFLYRDSDDALSSAVYIIKHLLPEYEQRGWQVEFDDSFPVNKIIESDDWFVDAEQGIGSGFNDWFDIQLGVLVDGERYNIVPLIIKLVQDLTRAQAWEEFEKVGEDENIGLLDPDGKMIKVPAKRIKSIAQYLMLEFANDSKLHERTSLNVSKWNAAFLSEFMRAEEAAKMRWTGPEELKEFAKKISEHGTIPETPVPEGLQCNLRPYQQAGLNWMQFLRECKMHGILADDMGLGKTIQALAHILKEKEDGRLIHPTIVIAPTSLMPNWLNEAKRFAPLLKVLVLHGNDRKNHFAMMGKVDLILTTYPLLMRDKEFILGQEYHLMILDEAQYVKNCKTQAYQIIQQIRAGQRLCLSGTPMENHLGELWALFHLILPGFLGNQKTFQNVYQKPIEKLGYNGRRQALTKRIRPFILRRTKQQVAIDLPEKTEIVRKIELKDSQRDLYESIRLRAQQKVMQQIQEHGLAKSHIILLDALLKLRQACCHPALVKFEGGKSEARSAKLDYLLEMLDQLLKENHKVLIFSQFTSMLAIIAAALDEKKIAYSMLTGETKDRSAPVNMFQGGQVPIMLISLKAGGVGLNLTAADTVIHYDPWWNPAAEAQATDRAHRIGQNKAVMVFKLVAEGSLEEKILAMQERKKMLAAAVMGSDVNITDKLTMEDLQEIFQPLPAPVGDLDIDAMKMLS